MDHLKTAYDLGARLAQLEFAKQAEPSLGDPAFWQGGEQAQQEQQAPATAEDAAMSLPTGTFQGLTTRLSPEGERSTSVKVTPDALGNPDILGGIFQAEPTAKVEVAQPQAKGDGQQDLGIPSNLPGSPPPDPLAQDSKIAGVPRYIADVAENIPGLTNKRLWNRAVEWGRQHFQQHPSLRGVDNPYFAKRMEALQSGRLIAAGKIRPSGVERVTEMAQRAREAARQMVPKHPEAALDTGILESAQLSNPNLFKAR